MSADQTHSYRVRLVLTVVALSALAGAGVLVAVGVRIDQENAALLDVDDAAASVIPSTVAPVATTPTTTPPRETTSTDAPSPATTTEPAPESSTTTTTTTTLPEPRPEPIGLFIDSIDVDDYPVRDIGLEDDGQLEIPDETEIGWYRYGATAGHPGSTVMAAHVSWNRTLGPFSNLGRVDPGDRVIVTLDDGTTREYEVTERTMYGKLELPRDRIWRRTGAEELVLITCGGEFNPEIRRYKSNIVVYAVPVGSGVAEATDASDS